MGILTGHGHCTFRVRASVRAWLERGRKDGWSRMGEGVRVGTRRACWGNLRGEGREREGLEGLGKKVRHCFWRETQMVIFCRRSHSRRPQYAVSSNTETPWQGSTAGVAKHLARPSFKPSFPACHYPRRGNVMTRESSP
jgi:hypothetical protein